ncbi:alpha/beta hydrolase [Streptomyces sp. NPDC059009]|uniref:alpha/beta hydrolase n=1 Tax=Streptomyces sp. NPDC059009 TaxID=3346694 RepID=UPI0036A8DF0D
MRRPTVLAAVTALALAGLPVAAQAAPSATPTPSPGPDLSRYYTQKIKWGTCEQAEGLPKSQRDGVQCGKVTVPLDYAKPAGDSVDLAMIRIKSSAHGKPRGSLLLNFGGPGGAGVSALLGAQKEFSYLGKGYDVVSFDPRGVGLSDPVSCGDAASDVDPTDSGTADAGERAENDPTGILADLRKAAAQCAKDSGPVLPYVGTVNVSRDMDVMRQALGDKKLNYLGFSYGTRLGAVYAAQFPKKVGRVVLDGVDTLTEDVAEQARVSAEGRQTALDNFLTWCTGNAGCVFGTNARTARTAMTKLVKDMDETPLQSLDGEQFTGQDLVSVLGQALYSRQAWPALSQALGGLMADGDPRALIRMGGALAQQATASPTGPARPTDPTQPTGSTHPTDPTQPTGSTRPTVSPDKIPADNMTAALMAVNCADDPDRPATARLEREIPRLTEEFEQTSPVFGRSMLIPVLLCYGRPAGTDYIREDVRDVDTPHRFLLVGTRGDPATPYRWAEETAKRLGSQAVLLDNKGDGHTGYLGSKCVREKVNSYLLYGEMPANGSSCAAE